MSVRHPPLAGVNLDSNHVNGTLGADLHHVHAVVEVVVGIVQHAVTYGDDERAQGLVLKSEPNVQLQLSTGKL